jgi:hypothetical protein
MEAVMRGTRIGRLCLLSAVVLGASVASSASAAEYEVKGLPELGRCVKVAPGAGVYKGGSCVTVDKNGKGKFNWIQLTAAEKQTLSGTAGETTLTTVGHTTIKCLTATISGEYTGPKTATVNIVFHSCTNSAAAQCQSEPTSKGEIKTLPLEAELGFIKNLVKEGKTSIVVGMDLKAQSPFSDLIIFDCGGLAESIRVDGSVIGRVKPINKMSTTSSVLFTTTSSGKQLPEKFQGEPNDTLTTTFMSGLESSSGASTLKILGETAKNSVPLEIKAKEN